MSGSSFGTLFRITTWGESHGPALGVVIDGCPAGIPLTEQDIQPYMDRRKPGQTRYTTPRKESDTVELLSGIFEGKTTGTPISVLVRNTNQQSKDYSHLESVYRPGHADYTFDAKYGIRDYRGGGRSSGRETLARVAAGAIAARLLSELGIDVLAYTAAIGPVSLPQPQTENGLIRREDVIASPLYLPDPAASKEAEAYLLNQIQQQDSAGGIIVCQVTGLPAGIGEPVFDKLDACLAKAVLSIGAVKGVEFGTGFHAAAMTGSEHNDAFCQIDGKISKRTNHAGGVLGGMSDGSPLLLRAALKPTPSIARTQQTVLSDGTETELSIHGRHDPVIVPRAVVVVEAMVAITLADLLLQNATSRIEQVKKIYFSFAAQKPPGGKL